MTCREYQDKKAEAEYIIKDDRTVPLSFGFLIPEVDSYINWQNPNDRRDAEKFDTLLYDNVQYERLSYERKTDILARYPLSQNKEYQENKKTKRNRGR
ncbi:MAG: hypothetical protein J6A69_03760 [Clostridia bacterium]|nr:hypothetical protein [Clostridia bacterium]